MLYVISTLLLLVNAVTCRRVKSILFNRVAILILLYSGIICYDSLNIISLDTVIGIHGGLFHNTFKTHSFALFLCIIRAIVFQLTVYYPRRSQKSMGAMGRKISSFLLTQYTGSYLEIFLNNLIKMWNNIRYFEFVFIILLILIGQIFLISSSDFFSIFISIKLQSYDLDVFETLYRNFELSTTVGTGFSFGWDPFWLAAIIPIKTYSNAEADKDTILSDSKNKSGIYMWTNLTNGKQYIGSSQNLKKRFMEYFNKNHLVKTNYMTICCALLKHDYCNFSLTILEYCSPNKCLIREKYYWDIVEPKYNIAKDPTAPMSGRKHSKKTKTKISDAAKKIDHPGRFKTGENNPNFGKKSEGSGTGRPFQAIEVTDIKNNTTTSYDSINEAARALNINNARIVMYFSRNQKKPYKGQYTFKKL